jgi:CubicO group peptidase (beta-lactamase class C family)
MSTKKLLLILTAAFILACVAIIPEESPIPKMDPTLIAQLTASVGTATPTPAQAEPTRVPSGSVTDPRVDEIMKRTNITKDSPGAAVLVIERGKVIHQKGYGLADLEKGAPIAPHTALHLGSVGKQFTALGVMLLHEQGKLEYDDPIGKYIPELKWTGAEVTIRRLLHHTSGLPDYDEMDALYNRLIEISAEPRNADLLKALSKQSELLYTPGSKFLYSNTGYDVLGALIEKISGQSYADFMQERVFTPLGMTHTFALPNEKRNAPYVALSYWDDGGQPAYYEPDPMDNIPGSGGIYSSIGDMVLYDQALYTDKLVKQSTLAEAFTEGKLNNGEGLAYGFAWELGTENGNFYTAHSGAWLGFTSYYLRFPEKELSVVLLCNFDYLDPDEETLAFEIADLYLR